jgi:hypothetical protein
VGAPPIKISLLIIEVYQKSKTRRNPKECAEQVSLEPYCPQNLVFSVVIPNLNKTNRNSENISGIILIAIKNNTQIASKKKGVEQNPNNRVLQSTKEPKIKYLVIPLILVGLPLFGFGGYFLGRQSSRNANNLQQNRTISLPSANGNDETPYFQKYEDKQNGLEFDYPHTYTILTNLDCGTLLGDQKNCLLSLSINSTKSNYPPKAGFWFVKGIDSVKILGQVSTIPEILSVWDHTKLGQAIYRTTNGGSHTSFYYYIIPNYENDEVAIFSIPQSYRLRCDNFIDNELKEDDCNHFYNSVINQYNSGKTIIDTWLPETYLSSIYSEAENMVKSFKSF